MVFALCSPKVIMFTSDMIDFKQDSSSFMTCSDFCKKIIGGGGGRLFLFLIIYLF